MTKRCFAVAVGLMLVATLVFSGLGLAAKGGGGNGGGKGGGGGDGSPPPGTIYYEVSGGGAWSMDTDGGGKAARPRGEPSYLRHGDDRWFLDYAIQWGNDFPIVPQYGGSPDGCAGAENPQIELVAVRQSDGLQIPLTNALDSQVCRSWRWAKDDASVSFVGLRWIPVGPGEGNGVDVNGDEWLIEAFVFSVVLDWSVGVPVPSAPLPVVQGDIVPDGACWVGPDIFRADWSPDGTRVVYEQRPGYNTSDYLGYFVNVADLLTGQTQVLSAGANPEWSPDGARIAMEGTDAGIYTIRPDGTGLVQVTSATGTKSDGLPTWSPDSAHLAFTRWTQSNVRGSTTWATDVMRVPAAGGKQDNLTKDVADNAYGIAWR